MKRSRILPSLTAILILLAASSARAADDDAAYDNCLLSHLKGTKIDAASQLITQACNQNYRQHDFASAKERAYNQCLLDNLGGVESVDAMSRIMAACRRRSEDAEKL